MIFLGTLDALFHLYVKTIAFAYLCGRTIRDSHIESLRRNVQREVASHHTHTIYTNIARHYEKKNEDMTKKTQRLTANDWRETVLNVD